MGKRNAQLNCTGQLAGAKVVIKVVQNEALQEYVIIVNLGTIAQPMGGWALASLRGQEFYLFPDDLIILPKMMVAIHSGQGAHSGSTNYLFCKDLFWTEEQIWNNQGDIALLFEANGLEVDRYTYPHERILGSAGKRRLCLLNDGEAWRVVEDPVRQRDEPVRQANGPSG